jgi:Ca2+/H+ antiporter
VTGGFGRRHSGEGCCDTLLLNALKENIMHNAGFGGWIVAIVIAAALITAAAVALSKRANRKVGSEVNTVENRLRNRR